MASSPSERYVPFEFLQQETKHVMENYGTVKSTEYKLLKNKMYLNIMNQCSERCNLRFVESGM